MFKSAREKVRKSVYIPIDISAAIERRASQGEYESFSAVVARILLKELHAEIAAHGEAEINRNEVMHDNA